MEGGGGREDLSDTEADTSEAESVAGTDPGKAEVEPEVTVRRHNYNLRPKRRAPVPDGVRCELEKLRARPGRVWWPTKTKSAGVTKGPWVDPMERVSGPKARTPDDQKRERRAAGRAVYLAIRRSLIRMVVCPVFGTRGRVRH